MIVRLDKSEALTAAIGGSQRHLRQAFDQRKNTFDGTRDLWSMDIEAAAAELAFAKATNQYWAPTSRPDWDGDVGTWQVRHTQRTQGHLIVYNGDRDTDRFVLVTGKIPEFHVIGWLLGAAAKKPGWWAPRMGRPCFMVPQGALTTFDAERVAA